MSCFSRLVSSYMSAMIMSFLAPSTDRMMLSKGVSTNWALTPSLAPMAWERS